MNVFDLLARCHLRRPSLRIQLTALYAGLAVALVAAVLFATGLLYRHTQEPAGAAGVISHGVGGGGTGAGSQQFDIAPALIALVVVAITVAVAWWLAGRFLRPLRVMTTTAREISAADLHRRLDLHGPDDELTGLGRTLDDLFGRLDASFESQRRFVANASHELRTPLAGQRTLLQVALADPEASAENLRAACEEALTLGERQDRLIDALLALANGEKGIEQWESFDLADVAEKVVTSRRPEAERRQVTVHASLHPAPLTGDPRLVESMIANLVDNAIRHNIRHGNVTVSTGLANDHAQLSVGNTGPVVRSQDLRRLFHPFQRLGAERTRTDGHGLGLAIVRAIADAHDAVPAVHPRPDGGLDVIAIFR
jgi:signal transduction histidine kinase